MPKFLNVLLALAAQDVAHELPGAVVHPLTRLLVNVDVCVSFEGIGAILDVGHGKRNIGTSVFGEVDLLHVRVVLGVKDGPPSDAIFVFGKCFVHALTCNLSTISVGHDLFLFDILFEILVPLIIPVKELSLDIYLKARRDIAVGLDRFISPFTGQAELAPGADVFRCRASILARVEHAFPTTRALRAEDVVQLLHGEFGEWIVLIHYDLDGPKGAARLVATRGDDEFGRQILLDLVERKQITDLCVISGRGNIDAEDIETRNGTLAGLSEVVAKRSVGMEALEALLPDLDLAFERAPEDTNRALDLDLGLIRRRAGSDPDSVPRWAGSSGKCSEEQRSFVSSCSLNSPWVLQLRR